MRFILIVKTSKILHAQIINSHLSNNRISLHSIPHQVRLVKSFEISSNTLKTKTSQLKTTTRDSKEHLNTTNKSKSSRTTNFINPKGIRGSSGVEGITEETDLIFNVRDSQVIKELVSTVIAHFNNNINSHHAINLGHNFKHLNILQEHSLMSMT
jgi:hypothetical protein